MRLLGFSARALFVLSGFSLFFSAGPMAGQAAAVGLKPIAQSNRVPDSADMGARTELRGHVPAWANASREVAGHAVSLSAPARVSITLQRDPAVQAAFEQLLADQQNPSSPMYHHWLTSTEIGQIYGPTQHDVDALTSWLSAQGLTIVNVAPSRMLVDADGTVQTVGAAFETSFAYYTTNGHERRAARTEPKVPLALAPVIAAIGGMAEIIAEPMSHIVPLDPAGPQAGSLSTPQGGSAKPLNTASQNSVYYLAAGDFDTIYDIDSVVTGGNTGAKIGSATQYIAIIGRSAVTTADITNYMANYGAHGETTYNLTQTQVPSGSGGASPGTGGISYGGDTGEATLDVQRVVGTANGAQAVMLYSASANGMDGTDIAENYNVNTLMYPVMTISFGLCEANSSSSQQTSRTTIFSQAAAEGITTLVSSGDSQAAGCDAAFTTPPTTQIVSPNYLCATGYVTCVGGTEFADASSYTTYWNNMNATSGGSSAKGYIPEGAWSEPGTTSGSYVVQGTGGGVSSYFAKPSFQTGTGVPADGYRDTPDVAFSAAGHDGYLGYLTQSSGGTSGIVVNAGTSAAAPGMAGIVALLNTKQGFSAGNLNPLIYKLAATNASAFHDVTVASSGVSSCTTATPSMCNNSTAGSATSLSGGAVGYAVTAGFDQATGWGSLDVANFLTAAAAANVTVSSTHSGNFTGGGASNTYTLTVTNSGATTTSGTISVTDTLPSGFAATAMSGTGWTCTLGTLTCTRSDALAANTSDPAITLTVTVTATQGATYLNKVAVTLGGAASDSAIDETYVLSATLAPTLAITFSTNPVAVGANTSMTFTVSNPNSAQSGITLNGVGFTNILPTNVAYSAYTQFGCTSGSTGSLGYNSSTVQYSSGTLAAGGYCLITMTTAGSVAGSYPDTSSTVTTSNSSAGAAAAATLIVGAQLSAASAHSGSFKAGDTADTYTLTVSNGSGGTATSGTVTVTDTLPSGFTATAMSGTGWTCTVASKSCTRSDALAAGASYAAVTLTASIVSTDAGSYTNSVAVTGGSSAASTAGTDATTVVGEPTLAESFSPATVAPNANSTVTFTVGNPSANTVTLTGVAFSDTLPTGLKIASPSGVATTCSGTVTATAGTSAISLTGASVAAGSTCTVSANVNSASINSYPNPSSTVTSTNANAGSGATATLTVTVTPTKVVFTSVPPTSVTAGGNAGTVQAALEDGSGNVATNNSTSTVTFAVTGPSGYSQNYGAMTVTNGVASINLSSVPLTVAGTYTYTATSSGLTTATASETVNPGTTVTFTVTGLVTAPYPAYAETATVKAVDSYGNTVTGFTGTVTLTSGDASAVFSPASYTYVAGDAGVHAFGVTFNKAGTYNVTATTGSTSGSQAGVVVRDAIWVLDGSGTLAELSSGGGSVMTTGSAGTTATLGGVAFDSAGELWAVSSSSNAVRAFSAAGSTITVSGSAGAGVSAPVALAIDGNGYVWVANGNSTLSELSNAGAAQSISTGYGLQDGLNGVSAIAIDKAGGVWVTNKTGNSVTHLFGAGTPVTTPLAGAVAGGTLGAKP